MKRSHLIWHLLRDAAERMPEKEALVQGQRRLTYAQVEQRVAGLASGLRAAGLKAGDRVGVYFDPCTEQAEAIFAVARADGVYVPISPLLQCRQVVHIAQDCGITALIASSTRLAQVQEAAQQIPSLKFVVIAGRPGAVDPALQVYDFEGLCGFSAGQGREAAIDRDLAAILYTSGSTGKPKGVMLSHANIVSGSHIVSEYLELTRDDRILAVLPLSFDAGMNQLMTAFENAGTLVMLTFRLASEVVHILRQEHITGLAGVPTFWSLLTQPTSTLFQNTFPELRYITNTGGAMPSTVVSRLRQALPTTKLYLMYGLTESFRSTYLPPEDLDTHPGSIGRAIPNTQVFLINEHGSRCKPGETGELVHRGPTVSLGYWNRPEETTRVFRPNPFLPREMGGCEKVCFSGDLVRMDQDGYLYFVGRRDTLIKSSGYRISPTEIEEQLLENGTLRSAAVIGVPDEVLGQVIKAFVTPRNGSVDTKALLRNCASHLPSYMVPKWIEVLDELPTTPTGKVDYAALRLKEGT